MLVIICYNHKYDNHMDGIFVWVENKKHTAWQLYDMETLSAQVALCEASPPVTSRFPSERASLGMIEWNT